MNKYILGINGMRCGMCESHINDTMRKNFQIKKVESSHIKNQTIVISEQEISEQDFKNALAPTGYELHSYEKTEAVKKFLSWK